MLVDRTADDRKLVAFTDLLALMYALEAWDRDNFFPIPELQKHSNVILPLFQKIRNRKAETVL
eukprot:3480320-Rhodomonas_salina.1